MRAATSGRILSARPFLQTQKKVSGCDTPTKKRKERSYYVLEKEILQRGAGASRMRRLVDLGSLYSQAKIYSTTYESSWVHQYYISATVSTYAVN